VSKINFINQVPEGSFCEIREELARGGLLTAFSIKTKLGWNYVDSPYEPRGEAKRSIGDSLKVERPVILLGSGSGFFLRVLVDLGIRNILILTGSRELAERNISRYEKRFGDLNPCQITIIASNDPVSAWQIISGWVKENKNPEVLVHPREIHVFRNLLLTIQIELLLFDADPKSATTKSPRKIVLVGNNGLFEHELVREFYRRGIEVTQEPRFAGKRITPSEALKWLRKMECDLVISTNNLGSDNDGVLPEVCLRLGIKWATWLLDDPEFLVGLEEREGVGKVRIGFCWDVNGEENWEKLGFMNKPALPLATDESLFNPGQGLENLEGRLVFVGSPRFASSMGYFSRLDTDPEARRIAEMLLEEVIQSRKTPLLDRLKILLREEGLENHFELDALYRFPAYIVQQANLAYRQQLLNSLADYNPVVYGEGWEGLLDQKIELRGSVDYYRELPKIYQSDAIHLSFTNLQMCYYPNQRPFDVGASGRVVLMDKLAGLEELFGEWINQLVFKNKTDLKQKIDYLIKSKPERQRLGQMLRKIVLEKHTIRHRVDNMFNYLYSKNS